MDLQEQIIDILNKSQNEFKGINEANLDSAFHIEKLIENREQKAYDLLRRLIEENMCTHHADDLIRDYLRITY